MSATFKYDTLAEVGTYDYSWTLGYIIRRHGDGQLFYGVTGGCSCNDWSENIEDADLKPIKSWQEAVDLAKGPGQWSPEPDFSDSEVADFVQSLMGKPGDLSGVPDMWAR